MTFSKEYETTVERRRLVRLNKSPSRILVFLAFPKTVSDYFTQAIGML